MVWPNIDIPTAMVVNSPRIHFASCQVIGGFTDSQGNDILLLAIGAQPTWYVYCVAHSAYLHPPQRVGREMDRQVPGRGEIVHEAARSPAPLLCSHTSQ